MFDPSQIPNVWRAQSLVVDQQLREPTGFASLDAALGGGWPRPSMIEILTDEYGIGEIQLILPLLRSCNDRGSLTVAWIDPPHEPNAVALAQHGLLNCPHLLIRTASQKDVLYSIEKALESGACGVVLAWIAAIKTPSLQRLKLAVASEGTYAILYRPASAAAIASPAHVRLQLNAAQERLHVRVLKARSRPPTEFTLDVDAVRLHQDAVP